MNRSNFEIHVVKLAVFDSFFFYKLLSGDRQEGRIVHPDFLFMLLNKALFVTSPRSPIECPSPAPVVEEELDEDELSFNDVFEFAATESEGSCSATSSPAQDMYSYSRSRNIVRSSAERVQQLRRGYCDAWGASMEDIPRVTWFY